MSIFTGRATVPEPTMSDTPGAKSLRAYLVAKAELDEREARINSAASRIEVGLNAFQKVQLDNRGQHVSPRDALLDVVFELHKALLETRDRLAPPTHDGGKT